MKGRNSLFLLALYVATAVSIYVPDGICEESNAYVGSQPYGCNACHRAEYDLWSGHGHSKMLRPVTDGVQPENTDITLPENVSWDDVSYLIGGEKNYARFADKNGYVMTGREKQWSLKGKTLTHFKPDIPDHTLKYACVKCHTTGWRESGAYPEGVQNDLAGIPGAWFENGVGCEACHGPGHQHVLIKNKAGIKKTNPDDPLKIITARGAEACGECHKRNADDAINVVGPELVQSRQQYTVLKFTRKANFKIKCIDCHNPHATSRDETGFVRDCETCHKGRFAMPVAIEAMEDLKCVDCHMPLGTRGGYDTVEGDYRFGDTRSHVFGITADPNYTLDNGGGHATLTDEGLVRLTVEMTCYACHRTGKATEMSRETLLSRMQDVHVAKN